MTAEDKKKTKKERGEKRHQGRISKGLESTYHIIARTT